MTKEKFMDMMLDIETLGTSYNAVITQIGACYFDRNSGRIKDTFKINIQIQDCLNKGLRIDAKSIKFWLEQKGRSFLKEPVTLDKALESFRQFCGRYNRNRTLIWSHSTFDFVILTNAYKICNSKPPVPYRNTRDIRTLVDLANISRKKEKDDEKSHDALEDCIYQVKYCTECFEKLYLMQNRKE